MSFFANETDRSNGARVRLSYKILYGIGEIANSVKIVIFGLYALFFATTVLGLPAIWVGVIGFITLLWDAIIDPYIGYLSDRASYRFGRRHTFMLAGALVMGVSFWAFFSPPPELSTPLLFIWLLFASLLLRTAVSAYSIAYYALGAELSTDYDERTVITGIRGLLSVLGTLAIASLSFVVFFPDNASGIDPKLDPSGYRSMGFAFGLVMTTIAIIATLGTLPLRRHVRSVGEIAGQPTPRQFFAATVQSWKNPSFRVLFLSVSMFFLALTMNSSLLIHYMTYYVGISASADFSRVQVAFFVGGLLGTVCWMSLARYIDKHFLFFFTACVTAVLMSGARLFFGEGNLFGTGDVRPLLAGYGIAGFFGCILWFVPQSMLADIVDENELLTGKRQEGSFFGIFSFGQQVATGLSMLLAGGLLHWFAKLVPGESLQSAVTGDRIGIIFGFVPAVLVVVAAVVILKYRLTRANMIQIQLQLNGLNSLSSDDVSNVGVSDFEVAPNNSRLSAHPEY